MSQPYVSLEAEFHDAFWAEDDDATEVSLMERFLASHPGRALEIGSGSGRLLLPLLTDHPEVEGLELSDDMIRLCHETAELAGEQVVVHRGDMIDWTPEIPYRSLVVPAFTFQLAEDPEATLRHWHTLLVEGGGLYLTVFIPFAELEGDTEENVWNPDHQTTLADGRIAKLDTLHRIDPEKQILDRQHRYYFADSQTNFHESRQILRWFTPEQLQELLTTTGFKVTEAFVDFDPTRPVTQEEIDKSDGIVTFHAITQKL
jgi:SAM-dependent methyltransferase